MSFLTTDVFLVTVDLTIFFPFSYLNSFDSYPALISQIFCFAKCVQFLTQDYLTENSRDRGK